MNPELLNYEQLSKAVNIPVGTLQWWVHKKKIKHIRLGPRLVRFRRSDVDAFLREREIAGTDTATEKT